MFHHPRRVRAVGGAGPYLTLRSRVMSCLASSTEQMNSLRTIGAVSFPASSAVGWRSAPGAKCPGSLCTTSPGTRRAADRTTVAGQGEPHQNQAARSDTTDFGFRSRTRSASSAFAMKSPRRPLPRKQPVDPRVDHPLPTSLGILLGQDRLLIRLTLLSIRMQTLVAGSSPSSASSSLTDRSSGPISSSERTTKPRCS